MLNTPLYFWLASKLYRTFHNNFLDTPSNCQLFYLLKIYYILLYYNINYQYLSFYKIHILIYLSNLKHYTFHIFLLSSLSFFLLITSFFILCYLVKLLTKINTKAKLGIQCMRTFTLIASTFIQLCHCLQFSQITFCDKN